MSNRLLYFVFSCALLAACENPVVMRTRVNEDGSLSKTIILDKASKDRATHNIFGIRAEDGWKVELQKVPSDSAERSSGKEEYRIEFMKTFGSADEMNLSLDREVDTLFRVHTKVEKNFRWFYTYIRYSETIRPINRFKKVDPNDYFNLEDNSFVDRLPGEGTTISKADSVFLNSLTEKINTTFANMGIYREQFDILSQVIQLNGLDKQWQDTLARYQSEIYEHVDQMKGDPFFAEKMADTLKIPLPKPKASADFAELSRDLNQRLNFMSFANDGKYTIEVEMPWPVRSHNADSVAGNMLVWRPLVTKFVYKEYVLLAESRKANGWAFAVSAAVIGLTIVLYTRRKRVG